MHLAVVGADDDRIAVEEGFVAASGAPVTSDSKRLKKKNRRGPYAASYQRLRPERSGSLIGCRVRPR
jgi:hypothetical protein